MAGKCPGSSSTSSEPRALSNGPALVSGNLHFCLPITERKAPQGNKYPDGPLSAIELLSRQFSNADKFVRTQSDQGQVWIVNDVFSGFEFLGKAAQRAPDRVIDASRSDHLRDAKSTCGF